MWHGIRASVANARRRITDLDFAIAPQIERSRRPSAWCGEVAWRLADLDAEMNLGSAGRVHLHLHGVDGSSPLRRERAVHDGADLAVEVSGAHHFRDGLVFLPGERGGYLGLNRVLGNRRRAADADMGAAASEEPASGRHRNNDGQNVLFTFYHAVILQGVMPAYQRHVDHLGDRVHGRVSQRWR